MASSEENLKPFPIDRYEKTEVVLGSGGFGVVKMYERKQSFLSWKKDDRSKHKSIAVKKQFVKTTEEQARLIRRELDIMSKIQHVNIVSYLGNFETKGKVGIVMELCQGTLKELVTERQLNLRDVAILMKQLLQAVSYLHDEKNIIHRDIKPDNILIQDINNISSGVSWQSSPIEQLTLKLSDFGLSRHYAQMETTESMTMTVAGTKDYMAPEVQKAFNQGDQSIPYTKYADIWSCGCVAYFLRKGNLPVDGLAILDQDLDWGYGFFDFLKRMISVERKGRHTAMQMLYHKFFHNIETSLHRACNEGDLLTAKYLAEECKAEVNAKDTYNQTPLHVACRTGQLHIVQYLVELCKAEVNVKAQENVTPLHFACYNGHLHIVQFLVEECKAEVNVKDENNQTPLHLACSKGHLPVVKYLVVECKAEVNAKDVNNKTPLHLVCWKGDLLIVKYLVEECKAEVNAKDENNRTALHWACRNGHLPVVQYLAKECKAEVNAKDKNNMTPLHAACRGGHLPVVQYLVKECEAEVHAMAKDNVTPLHWVCYDGHLHVVKYLVEECKAEVNEKDKNNGTPLHAACRRGHLHVVQYLVKECEAEVNAKANDNVTPLLLACCDGHLPVVKYLVAECKAEVNAKNKYNRTPLHLACMKGHLPVVQYLVREAQADLIIKDNDGRTPKQVIGTGWRSVVSQSDKEAIVAILGFAEKEAEQQRQEAESRSEKVTVMDK